LGGHTVDSDDKRFALWIAVLAAVLAVVILLMPEIMGWFMRS
jgi:hypothetical protein